MSAKPLKWRFDLSAPSSDEPKPRIDADKLKAPGDVAISSVDARTSKAEATNQRELKLKKGWEAAIAPANQLFMLGLMAWMIPHQASLISLSIVIVTFMGPFKAVASVNSVFAGLADDNGSTAYLLQYKLIYIFLNLIGCAIGLWKLSKFGLLPITQADWISWYSVPQPLQVAQGVSTM